MSAKPSTAGNCWNSQPFAKSLFNLPCSEIRLAYGFGGIVGARRHGISLPEILADTKLAVGDTLLVVCGASLLNSYQNSKDFYVACSVGGVPRAITWSVTTVSSESLSTQQQLFTSKTKHNLQPEYNLPVKIFKVKTLIATLTHLVRWDYVPVVNFMLLIILPAADIIPMEQSAILFASTCFLCGWITPGQALEVIDFSLVIMIAASIGISRAMEKSGVSQALGDWLKNSEFTAW